MMSKQRVSLTLPSDLVETAQRVVATGGAQNLSAYLAEALEEKLNQDRLAVLLEEIVRDSRGAGRPADSMLAGA